MTRSLRYLARSIPLAAALAALSLAPARAQTGQPAAAAAVRAHQGPLTTSTATPARARLGQPAPAPATSTPAPGRDEPVTFTADQVEYDRERAIVTARGHVEAWQAGRILRADQMTFDRNSGVSVATGNVVLVETNGQTLFAQYAELNRDMSEGILKTIGGRMEHNARLAANGMRRTGGALNELSRIVYSVCDSCKEHPERPLLWQLEAASAVQDTEHKTIEYRDAVMRMYGIPVAYAPFFWHPDPSVPRQSGLLPPSFGLSSSLGGFYAQPYYWVIDGKSDATITPMATTRTGGVVDAKYRLRLNDGTLSVNVAAGYQDRAPQGSFSGKGQFAIDDNWRWGFDINRASSSKFVLNQHLLLGLTGDAYILSSNIYVEGFGQGSYSRLDLKGYQALSTAVATAQLPVVAPRYIYSFTGEPDRLGGRLSLDAGLFNIVRYDGTNTRRASLTMNWERPFQGPVGDLWKLTLHGDTAGYDASSFQHQPNFGPRRNVSLGTGQAGASLDFRWPFMRDAGAWGTQVIEPMAQLVVSPNTGDSQIARVPNEDSFAFEFNDTNLFAINRFNGIDRLDGGTRLNVALHSAWYLGGTMLDTLVGQSYQTARNNLFPAGAGLRDPVSDIVARGTFTPAPWLDLTYRTRLDKSTAQIRMADASFSAGGPKFQVTGGYLYSAFNPFYFYTAAQPLARTSAYFQPRNEVSASVSSRWEKYRVSAYVRRNLANNQFDYYGLTGAYEDECFIFDVRFTRRLTSLLGDNGSTALLFFLTFKTVGQVGYRAF